MAKQVIDRVDVSGNRVLMRVDFNVPMEGGVVTDDRRIRMALPSIKSVLERRGRLVLMSHLGRPSGNGYEEAYSLAPVAKRLGELLGDCGRGAKAGGGAFPGGDCVGEEASAAVEHLADGEALLLENLRFHNEEKAGDPAFAAKLASYGDIYCNNAFGTCHRDDASMVAVPEAMPGKPRVAGSLVDREIQYLSDTLAKPRGPFVVVLGGAKVSDKLTAVEFLSTKADAIVVGGAMAYTFLKAQGVGVGASRVEEEMLDEARRLLTLAKNNDCEILLPTDHVCSTEFSETSGTHKTFKGDIEAGYMGLDIGPDTIGRYSKVIEKAKTIVWNGPMGVFEWGLFAVGTKQIAEAIARATAEGAISIVGGGDSAAAAEKFEVASKLSHVSTGGGASLEMLSGKAFKSVALLDEA